MHNRPVSMYAGVLADAIAGWNIDLSGDALLRYVLACRADLPTSEFGAGWSAQATLVAQIAYDRALITLASSNGIDASPQNFRRPQMERRRLEAALSDVGICLGDPSTPGP